MGDLPLPPSSPSCERDPLLPSSHPHIKLLQHHISRNPIHHTQPAKALYLTSRILFLPALYLYWHLINLLPGWRPLPSWPLNRAVGCRLIRWATWTFFHGNSLPRPDTTSEPTAQEFRALKKVGGRVAWIPPIPEEQVREPIRGWAREQGVRGERVRGYWMGLELEGRGKGGGGNRDESRSGRENENGHASGNGNEHGSGRPPLVEGEKVILFLHGGSYITGSGHPSELTSYLPLQSLLHSRSVRATLAIDYRLSSASPNPPTNPFPAALLDALAAFDYLLSLQLKPKQILIAGDSAGGNLALALTRYLTLLPSSHPSRFGRDLAGLILLSPWSDLTDSHHTPNNSLVRNHATDYVLGLEAAMGSYSIHALCGEHVSPWSAWISPAARRTALVALPALGDATEHPDLASATFAPEEWEDATFHSWPRTLLLAGGREMILDEIRTLGQKMGTDGVPLSYREWEGVGHDFLSMWFMEPERTEAVRWICRWIDGVEDVQEAEM